MKPDKKYMSMNDEENQSESFENGFEPFEVPKPYENLNGWAPIINIDNLNTDTLNNYISSKLPYSLGSQINLSNENINDEPRSSSELYSYNNTSRTSLDHYSYDIPTPTDILREFDMDLDENELLDSYIVFRKNCNPEQVFQKIRVNNPLILKTMDSYRIPFPIAKTLIKRIITLTNNYCNNRE